jgi:voltage-gated potassium channel
MRPPQVSRTLSSQSSNSTPSQYAPIPHRQNILSRVKSSILRRESFVLNQPLSAEDSIPDDLITSESKSWNINNSIKKLATIYLRSNIARLLVLFGAVLSCILYVIETYVENESYLTFSFVMDLIIFTLFATDYLFNILYATIKWKYIFSSQGIIDLLSLLSIINVFNVSADLSFLPLFRLLRVIKVLRFFHIVSIMNVDRPKPPSASEAITFEIISLLITLILAIFLSASLLFTLMQQDPHSFLYTPDQEFSMKQDATFFDCVYIVLVIIATLGFGDFVPNNFVGRLFVVILLSSIVVLIPTKISQLVDTIGKKPRYMNEVTTSTHPSFPSPLLPAGLLNSTFPSQASLTLSSLRILLKKISKS